MLVGTAVNEVSYYVIHYVKLLTAESCLIRAAASFLAFTKDLPKSLRVRQPTLQSLCDTCIIEEVIVLKKLRGLC